MCDINICANNLFPNVLFLQKKRHYGFVNGRIRVEMKKLNWILYFF